MASNPDEIIEPPEQVAVDQKAPLDEEQLREEAQKSKVSLQSSKHKNGGTTEKTVDWTVSEDLDLTDVKSKPPPRLPVEPTYRGWKEVGGWEEKDALSAEDELTDLLSKVSFFDSYLPTVAYGDWYHNVGYVIVSGLLSWIFGWFRFSLAPVFYIMVVFSLLYRTSIRKYRTVLRSQAQREFSIKSIEDDYETMDWLNNFLEKFWVYLEPSVSQIVCEIANPILASSPAPAFVKQLWLDSFTAGTKPPRIDTVKTIAGTDDDIVVMDWGCSFTPNAIVDSNAKQLKNNVNQKVVVKANVFGLPVSVAVSDVSFKALVRVRLRMMSAFPHVQTANVTLLEPPHFDFNSKVLGDTPFNWEVLSFPGLYQFVNEMIKKYVGAMLFSPLSFQINLQQVMAGHPFGSAVGVLEIKAKSASGIINFSTHANTMDPYLTFGFNKDVLAKTKHIDNTSSPKWNETILIPVSTLSEPLNITVWDFNDFRSDRAAGSIQFDLEPLIKEPKQTNITQNFLRNNKPVGSLNFDLNFMPTLEAEKQPDGAVIPPPELNTGIARIEIALARNLKPGKDDKPVSSYVELYFDNEKLIESSIVKGNNSPSFGVSKERIVNNRAKAKVKIYIKNSKDDKIIGKITSTLNELIDATQVDEPWWPLARGGEVQINTSWKPVSLIGASGASSAGYAAPVGVVRVSVEKAEDLRNLETIGKIDPYCRILINGFERAQTAPLESNLNPTWNEVHYVTVSSANQKLTLEVMDVEAHSADRTLGSFDVKLNEIINKNEKGQFIEYVDSEKRESKLIHKKGPKGTLTYSLSFYPCLPVMTAEDIKDEEEERSRIEKERSEKAAQEKEKKKKTDADEHAGAVKPGDTKLPPPKQQEKDDKKVEEVGEGEEDDEFASNKLRLSLDQLLHYKSGVFVYEIIEGTLAKDDVYLQVFLDNHGHADYVSQKLKGKTPKIGVTGDAVVQELEKSHACFRITKKKTDNRAEKVVAETTIPTKELLQNGYDSPTTVTLEGASQSSFKVQLSWVPVIYEDEIPPQDAFSNSGILTVEVIKAEGLMSADRNGKSDPYIRLHLNTEKEEFFKTKKVKKTLEPSFGETGTVEVPNKYDSIVTVYCFDWDIGPEADDLLGVGHINLKDVPLNGSSTELSCKLTTEDGEDGGTAYFNCSFESSFVLNVKPASSTNIGDAFGAVGGLGKGVGKGVGKGIGGVGKGVGKGVGGGTKLLKKGLRFGSSD